MEKLKDLVYKNRHKIEFIKKNPSKQSLRSQEEPTPRRKPLVRHKRNKTDISIDIRESVNKAKDMIKREKDNTIDDED